MAELIKPRIVEDSIADAVAVHGGPHALFTHRLARALVPLFTSSKEERMAAETPDFDQIARDICQDIWGNDVLESRAAVVSRITEQLRLVWNARGAADLAALEAAHHGPIDQCGRDGTVNLERALRSVDR